MRKARKKEGINEVQVHNVTLNRSEINTDLKKQKGSYRPKKSVSPSALDY